MHCLGWSYFIIWPQIMGFSTANFWCTYSYLWHPGIWWEGKFGPPQKKQNGHLSFGMAGLMILSLHKSHLLLPRQHLTCPSLRRLWVHRVCWDASFSSLYGSISSRLFQKIEDLSNSSWGVQDGPLPVVSRVITPLIGVITPVAYLQGHL